MTKFLSAASALLSVIFLSSCGEFDVVDKSKDVVLSKAEYDRLKADAAEGKQVGRYQIHKEGFRTWRLDSATGRSCLLLTTEADRKTGAVGQNSCSEEDANRRKESTAK